MLHPEFVDGKYAFYTRPMDGFIETGSGGGIGFGLCDDIEHAVIDEEKIISHRIYHTLTESKMVPVQFRSEGRSAGFILHMVYAIQRQV